MPKDVNGQATETEEQKQEAENQSTETTSTNSSSADAEKKDETQVDGSKVIAKLQARLTKEQADKNEFKDKYENLKKEFESLKSGKSVKDIHKEDKSKQELAERDKQIKELEAKIKRSETLKEVDGIFKDADLSVSDEILNLVVADDNEKTVSNASAIIDLINKSREDGRNTILKGKTPKSTGKSINPKSAKGLSILERAKLLKSDPSTYNNLMGR